MDYRFVLQFTSNNLKNTTPHYLNIRWYNHPHGKIYSYIKNCNNLSHTPMTMVVRSHSEDNYTSCETERLATNLNSDRLQAVQECSDSETLTGYSYLKMLWDTEKQKIHDSNAVSFCPARLSNHDCTNKSSSILVNRQYWYNLRAQSIKEKVTPYYSEDATYRTFS